VQDSDLMFLIMLFNSRTRLSLLSSENYGTSLVWQKNFTLWHIINKVGRLWLWSVDVIDLTTNVQGFLLRKK